METFLSRYRNLSVLLALIVGQLLLLAYQVKAHEDVRLIRVWAVTAVTPLARGIEWIRSNTAGFFSGYVLLRDVQGENQRLRQELARLQLRDQFLSAEVQTADRAKLLLEFRSRIPSKTLPTRVIGTGTGANSRVVFVDRGSTDGVKRGMAAITADGIVGKIIAAYPTSSLVQLVTEQGSVTGVVSQKNHARGILKGQGAADCIVEGVQNEDKLEAGEWFYTSGTDRIFPRGLRVGQVKTVREGRGGKEVVVQPSAVSSGLEEMLLVLDGVHGLVPESQTQSSTEVNILPAPPAEGASPLTLPADSPDKAAPMQTDADKLKEKYKRIQDAEGLELGNPGRIPDFNHPPAAQPAASGAAQAKPATTGPPAASGAAQAKPASVSPPAASGAAQAKPAQAVPTPPVKPPSETPHKQ